jgi:hypothetical protein
MVMMMMMMWWAEGGVQTVWVMSKTGQERTAISIVCGASLGARRTMGGREGCSACGCRLPFIAA